MDASHDATPAEQLTAGAVVLGLVSLVTCWWFPFGPAVGAAGCLMGLAGRWRNPDAGRWPVGTLLAACGAGAGLLLAWDYWRRLIGA